ncbi:MAG: hypothetical protein NTX06_12415 [Proteobacteria bacterium]|nr:hypothetical protein [Pseudomonadota bacterium]
MLKNSPGTSTIGCLFTIAIVVFCFYAGYKFAVVQWNVESFKEELTEGTRFWANEHNLDDIAGIKADTIRRAAKCEINLKNNNISVSTEGASVIITASWIEPIEFPGGYIYEWEIIVSRGIRKFGL